MRHRMIRGLAFTLVELIVTISIIAVLAALMLPALNGAMSRARANNCVESLRQIATAMNLYAADNDNRFPASYVLTSNAADNNWWYRLSPYTGGKNVSMTWADVAQRSMSAPFHCPEVKNPDPRVPSNPWVSYKMSMQFRLKSAGNNGGVTQGMPRSRIQNVSQVLMVAEGRVAPEFGDYTTNILSSGVWYPHNGKMNGLFVDGHVESLTQAALTARWTECYSNFQ